MLFFYLIFIQFIFLTLPLSVIARRATPDVAIFFVRQSRDSHVATLLGMTLASSNIPFNQSASTPPNQGFDLL